MQTYHILAALHGEQDSQAALLRLDDVAIAAIQDARRAIALFASEKGSSPSLRHIGTYHIHFLSGIPDGFIPDLCAEDMSQLYDQPLLLTDLDETAFLTAAETLGFSQRSECTGLLIYPDALYIIGRERHSEQETESHDIHDLVDLTAETETDGATYVRCLSCGEFVIEGEWDAHCRQHA